MGERRRDEHADTGSVATLEEPTAVARYQAFKQEHDRLAQRLAAIEGLTLEEVNEQVALERLRHPCAGAVRSPSIHAMGNIAGLIRS
jgi:hypothetical protein